MSDLTDCVKIQYRLCDTNHLPYLNNLIKSQLESCVSLYPSINQKKTLSMLFKDKNNNIK